MIIEGVSPEIDCGEFAIKRTLGEDVEVSADIFAEGHDVLVAVVKYRRVGEADWRDVMMKDLGNDRWNARFTVRELGRYEYTVEGWVDHFASWYRELFKKSEAGQDVSSELLEGAELIREGAERATRVRMPPGFASGRSSSAARRTRPSGSRRRSTRRSPAGWRAIPTAARLPRLRKCSA